GNTIWFFTGKSAGVHTMLMEAEFPATQVAGFFKDAAKRSKDSAYIQFPDVAIPGIQQVIARLLLLSPLGQIQVTVGDRDVTFAALETEGSGMSGEETVGVTRTRGKGLTVMYDGKNLINALSMGSLAYLDEKNPMYLTREE